MAKFTTQELDELLGQVKKERAADPKKFWKDVRQGASEEAKAQFGRIKGEIGQRVSALPHQTLQKVVGAGRAVSKLGADAQAGVYRGLPGFLKTALLGNSNTILNKPFDAWSRARGDTGGNSSTTDRLLRTEERERRTRDAREDSNQQRLQAIQEGAYNQQKSQLIVLNQIVGKLDDIRSALEINGKQVGNAVNKMASNQGGSDLLSTLASAGGSLLGGKIFGKATGALGKAGGAIARGGKSLLTKIPGLGKLIGAGGAAVAAEKLGEKVVATGATEAVEKAAVSAAAPAASTAEKIATTEGIGLAEKGGVKVGEKGLLKGALSLGGKSIAKKIPLISILAGLGFGVDRAVKGDWKGAGGELLSGIVGTVPGWGTAGSIGIDVANAAHEADYDAQNKNSKGLFERIGGLFGGDKKSDKSLGDLVSGKEPAKEEGGIPLTNAAMGATALGVGAATLAAKSKASPITSAAAHEAEPTLSAAAGAMGHGAASGGRFGWLRKAGKGLGRFAPLLATGYFSLSDLMKKDEHGNDHPDLLGAGLNAAAGTSSFVFEKSKNPLLKALGPLLEFASAGIHGKGEFDEEKEKAEKKKEEIESMLKEGKISKEDAEKKLKEVEFKPGESASHIGGKVFTGEFLPKFMAESLPEILEHSEHHGVKKGLLGGLTEYAKKSPRLFAALMGGLGTGIYASNSMAKPGEGHGNTEHAEVPSEQHEEAVKKADEVKDEVSKNTDALKGHMDAIQRVAPPLETEKKETVPDTVTTDPVAAISQKSSTSIIASMLDIMTDKTKGIFVRMSENPFDGTPFTAPPSTTPAASPSTVAAPSPSSGSLTNLSAPSYGPAAVMSPEQVHNKLVTQAGFRGSVVATTPPSAGLGPAPPSMMSDSPNNKTANEELLRKEMITRGITDPQAQANYLANFQAESGLVSQSEKISESRANETMQNNRWLGNKDPGDGYKFRGRGFVQLTGRSNYEDISKKLFGDDRLVKNPDLANDPQIAAKIALEYHVNRLKARGIDPNKASVDDVTRSEAPADLAGEISNRRNLVSKFDPTDSTGKVASLMKGDLSPSGQMVSSQINSASNDIAQTTTEQKPSVIPITVPTPVSSNQQPSGQAGLHTAMVTRNDDSAIKALTLNFMSDAFPMM